MLRSSPTWRSARRRPGRSTGSIAGAASTTASIVTSGHLGDHYISLHIGGEEEVLKPGDEISFTESAVILERLIGQFIHSTNVGDGEKSDKEEKGATE